MIVFLVGMMGSGKSTVGKHLAVKLGYEFLDTDQQIEKMESMSISDIFTVKAEKYFRELEKKVILELELQNVVVSTGGGLPCYNDLMDRLNHLGTTIYLKCGTAELVKRIGNSQDRPLLKNLEGRSLASFINELKKKRSSCYSKSKYVVLGKFETVDVVNKVYKKLKLNIA
jgi:shikimate kinase